MTRAPYLFALLVVAGGVLAPGCSGTEFTGDAGDDDESATGGNGDSEGGLGGSSSGTAGTDAGGSNVGGNGNGGAGGNGGTSMGGSPMGGDAGEGATGGSGPGGMGGSSGASMGGAGSGSGGRAGSSGAGNGGRGGAGSGGKGGTGGAGSGGKGGTGGAGSGAGGKGGTSGAGSGGKGGTGGSGAGGKGGSGGTGASTCPPGPPSPSSACSFVGQCSYGTHPRYQCRDVYACDGMRWQQTQDATCGTPPSCEDLPIPPVINTVCSPEGAECQGNLYCLCAANCTTVCSLPAIWYCFGTPGSCPDVLPNRGQPCNVSLSCVYGSCATNTGVQAICDNGYWVWQFLDCPQ